MTTSSRIAAAWVLAFAPVQAWWKTLAKRERRLVGIAGAVLLLGLLYSLALLPAWRTLQRAPADHERIDAQLQNMQQLADETRQLRGVAPVGTDQAVAALKAATDRLGAKGKLLMQGDRAILTATGLEPSQLRDWLAEARTGARARPVEANLSRAAQGFNGTVVLSLGTKP
jgi:general secretion pathway protein M